MLGKVFILLEKQDEKMNALSSAQEYTAPRVNAP